MNQFIVRFLLWIGGLLLIFVDEDMRITLLIVPLTLCSCAGLFAPSKRTNLSYGGVFNPGKQNVKVECVHAIDSPKIKDVHLIDSIRKVIQDSFKYFPIVVDSIVPDSLQNGADKEYAAAADDLEKYRKHKKNLARNEGIYALISAPILALVIIYLESQMIGAPFLIKMLIVISGANFIEFWIIGFLIISLIPRGKLTSAINHIKKAPQKAPDGRRIEYEVRTLLMLKNFLTHNEINKIIKRIRQIAETDPYNPWLEKLKIFEQDEFQKKDKKGVKFLFALLGFYLFWLLLAVIF